MARTTDAAVIGVLNDDYGAREDGTDPDLTPYIATASVLTDRIAARATENELTVTDAELEIVERWLAAHFFKVSDRPASFMTVGKSQTTFDGKTAMYLQSTLYGQTAALLDPTGYLAELEAESEGSGRKAVTVFWGGKRYSQRTPYEQRS